MAEEDAEGLHQVVSSTREARPSFVEVARVTTGEIPSLAPTKLEEGESHVHEKSGPPEIFGSVGREVLCLAVCTWAPASQAASIGLVLVGLDITATDLGMTQGEISWIPAALSLATGSFLLLGGRLADICGRKKMLNYSMIGFTIWMLIASFATEKYLFLVSRGMQGLFASGAIPAALGIIGVAYPPGTRKNKAFATFSAGNPSGWVVGLIIGGLLTSYNSWRWGFRVVTIIGFIFTAIGFWVLPPDPPKDPNRSRIKIDWLGALLIVCGVGVFCYGLSDADNAPNGWSTWYIIFSIILGIAFIGVFILWEYRCPYPLMPLGIWKVPQFGRLMIVIALGFACFTGFLGFTWSLWFQQIDQASPIKTTLYFLPQFFTAVLANVVAALIMHRVNGTLLMVFSMFCFAVSGVMGAAQPPGLIYWAMSFPAMCIGVVGADMSNVVANMFATSNVSKEYQSISVAIVVTMLGMSQTISQAITSALITNIGGNGLSGDVPIPQLAKGYHAAFFFGLGCSIIAMVLAMTLKIGTRGHKGEKDLRDVQMDLNKLQPRSLSTSNNTEVIQEEVQVEVKQ